MVLGCGALGKSGDDMLQYLSQMREDDSQKKCVIVVKSSKAVHNCTRELNGKKLTMKCGGR